MIRHQERSGVKTVWPACLGMKCCWKNLLMKIIIIQNLQTKYAQKREVHLKVSCRFFIDQQLIYFSATIINETKLKIIYLV